MRWMRRLLTICILLVQLTYASALELLCTDEVCIIPTVSTQGEAVYGIVSPVGYHDVETIEQAARLDTLDGKVIALVGGSFMASTTMPVLKECILVNIPQQLSICRRKSAMLAPLPSAERRRRPVHSRKSCRSLTWM